MTDKMASVDVHTKTAIWLVGTEEATMTGSKLPSNKQVLSCFFYRHQSLRLTVHESARLVIKDVVVFWNKARIPIRTEQHATSKLEQLFHRWTLLKNARRQTDTQRDSEAAFSHELSNLFDIAHMNALEMMDIDEDRQFLLAQREVGRRGCMGGLDRVLASKESKKAKRTEAAMVYRQKQLQDLQQMNDSVALESSSDEDVNEGDAPELVQLVTRKRKRVINVVTPEVVAALDRTKVSDRKATYVLAAAAHSLGHDISETNISRSSIRRKRMTLRENRANSLKEEFCTSACLVVHWDGKLLKDLTGKELVDRLPVIVSGAGVNQLLGVPKLAAGTGEAQACAVSQLLHDWRVADQVSAMCFDTTSSNTGKRNGACVLLEQKLNKDLLYLACRHHIFEIVLASVVKESLGLSFGPDIAIFKRFQQNWTYIDQGNFETGVALDVLANHKETVISFATKQLLLNQVRDDYCELLDLTVIFLGGKPPRGVHFRACGAMHHVRWMAKAIYSLKMWLFKRQFTLTAREQKGIHDICLFVIIVYLRAWFLAPIAASVPASDLQFLRDLVQYRSVNADIADIAWKKISGQLWYLSEELVGLSFFDDSLSLECKREMLQAMHERVGQGKPLKRIEIGNSSVMQMTISDFVTKNTITLFHRLGTHCDFLDVDPQFWASRDDYRQSQETVKHLRVVNDCAERGVSLIAEYNSIITRDEEQKQFLLRVVQDHRRRFPDCNKELLTMNQ